MISLFDNSSKPIPTRLTLKLTFPAWDKVFEGNAIEVALHKGDELIMVGNHERMGIYGRIENYMTQLTKETGVAPVLIHTYTHATAVKK